MNIVLTGITGILGSQVFYELLKREDIDCFFLLIRRKGRLLPKVRLQKILKHPIAPAHVLQNPLILNKCKVFELDSFLHPNTFLCASAKNFFIHAASSVNLNPKDHLKDFLFQENLEFTQKIFTTYAPYLSKFTYISTAFCLGNVGGVLDNNFHNKVANYRNHYEASKHATEFYLRGQVQSTGVEVQIVRPSILGGTVYNQEKYFISCYKVYYLLARFFYNNPLARSNSIRLAINSKTRLNIVPVDYAAKVIAKVFSKNIEQLNIVHPTSTKLLGGLTRIFEAVNFTPYSFIHSVNTEFVLECKNKLEELYYNTIGLHLTPYFLSLPNLYDTRLLQSILPCPTYYTEDYLMQTIRYAVKHKFKNAW